MTLNIRLRTPADYPRLAEIESEAWGEPVTSARLEEIEARRLKSMPYLALVAELDGLVVGRAYAGRSLMKHEQDLYAKVFVHPDYRHRGIATALFKALRPFYAEHEHRRITGTVEDSQAEAIRWAERQGFRKSHHLFTSKLDLESFDDTPFREHVERVKAGGIRFVSYAELQSPAAERKFFELFNSYGDDVPDASEWRLVTYDEWRQWAVASKDYWPEGWLVALDEAGEWAGYTMMTRDHARPQHSHIFLTGVTQSYRGRGLGLALKVVAAQRAREFGIAEVTTMNHSANAPMLAINQRLGYVPLPGYYRLVNEAE